MPNAESRQNGILISHFDRLFVDFQMMAVLTSVMRCLAVVCKEIVSVDNRFCCPFRIIAVF